MAQTRSTAYRLSSYARAHDYNEPNAGTESARYTDKWRNQHLRLVLDEITESDVSTGIAASSLRLRVAISPSYDMYSSSSQATAQPETYEDLDLTLYRRMLKVSPSPLEQSGYPLRAVYRGTQVAFRYQVPAAIPMPRVPLSYRRFQLVFVEESDAHKVIQAIRTYCYCLDQSNSAKSRASNTKKYGTSLSEQGTGISPQLLDPCSSTHPEKAQRILTQQMSGQFIGSSQPNPSNIPINCVAPPAIDRSNFAASTNLPPVAVTQTYNTHVFPSAQPSVAPQPSNIPTHAHFSNPAQLVDSRRPVTAPPVPTNSLLEGHSTQVDSSLSHQIALHGLSADSRLHQSVSHGRPLLKSTLDQSGSGQRNAAINSRNSATHDRDHHFSHSPLTSVPPEPNRGRARTENVDTIITSLLNVSKGQSSILSALANNPEDLRRVTFGLLSDPTFVDMVDKIALTLAS